VRTPRRRDYAVAPPGRSVLEALCDAGRQVVGIGKIEDLFSGVGLTHVDHTISNTAGMEATLRWLANVPGGSLVFTNLNDFDTQWGHRNDVQGYAGGLRAFDAWLPALLRRLSPDDLLLISADHGNDPTTPSTDHSREYVPILATLGGVGRGVSLGTRRGLNDIGATVLEHLGVEADLGGTSFRGAIGAA
jgi:phosphopentomutase